jgi:hypothetical protein
MAARRLVLLVTELVSMGAGGSERDKDWKQVPGQQPHSIRQMGRDSGGNKALMWLNAHFDQSLLQNVSTNHGERGFF